MNSQKASHGFCFRWIAGLSFSGALVATPTQAVCANTPAAAAAGLVGQECGALHR